MQGKYKWFNVSLQKVKIKVPMRREMMEKGMNSVLKPLYSTAEALCCIISDCN